MVNAYLLRNTAWGSLLLAIMLSILPASVTRADSAPSHHYQPLLTLGRGEITSIDWQASGEKILVNTAAGVWLYDDQLRDVAHLENLTIASFSPKGDLIAGKRADKIVLLDANSLQLIQTFPDSASTLLDIKWSPDSNKIAGLWKNGQVVIWDAKTHRRLFAFERFVERNTFVWSPDNTKVVALDPGGNTASIWQIASPQRRIVLQLKAKSKDGASGGDLVWSPDGSQILRRAGLSDSALLQSWDAQNGELLNELENPGLMNMAYSADRQRLVVAFFQGIQVVDPKTFKVMVAFDQSPMAAITHWSPDGRTIAGFGTEWLLSDGFVSLWDASTGKRTHYFTSHSSVLSFLWSPDSRRFLIVNRDNMIRILDADSGMILHERAEYTLVSQVTAWNFDGDRIAVADTIGNVRIWDVKTKQISLTLKGTVDIVQIAWQPNGKLLAVASEIDEAIGGGVAHDVSVHLWNTETGQNVATFPGDNSILSPLIWSNDGTHLATPIFHGKVILWDVTSQKFSVFTDFKTSILSEVSFSPDGTKLLVLSDACCVGPVPSIWDVETAKPLRDPILDDGRIRRWRSYEWGESGKMLFRANWSSKDSYCGDGGCGDPLQDPGRFKVFIEAIYPLNMSTQTLPPIILQGHTNFINSTIWSPDTQTIATTSLDRTLRTWNPNTGAPLLVIGNVDFMVWSPDSRLMAVWAIGGPTRILEATTGKTLDTLDIPNSAFEWSPDSTKIAHVAGGILTIWGQP
ncbi:MAG: hypothetical protein ABI947_19720 [Chloroflexota bacterium]